MTLTLNLLTLAAVLAAGALGYRWAWRRNQRPAEHNTITGRRG